MTTPTIKPSDPNPDPMASANPNFTTTNSDPDPETETETDTETLPLTVRFSASIPDLLLDIPSPSTTTAAGLKQLIRSHLPRDLSTHRLRLIYAGRGLEDAIPLTVSLKLHLVLPPGGRADTGIIHGEQDGKDKGKGKGKGKEPVRDRPRVYVHCSIGDIVLSDEELGQEASVASTLLLQQRQEQQGKQRVVSGGEFATAATAAQDHAQQQLPSTTPAPRGFERLLSAGFTPAEVSALRSQFLAIQSVSRTPDTMPTGSELRELEDRWMDEGSAAVPAGMGGGGADGVAFGGDDDGGFGAGSRGAIDDMLWGAVMGFFWPVGCAMWLRREEGVWSWRKGLAVFVGVIVNAAFGLMRIMG